MSKEEIEKAKEIMNKFKNNEMQRDKLERDCRCGGWKIGDVYKHLELNPAIETLLQYIDQLEQENNKLNKMIDEMAEFIVSSAVVDDTVCSRIFCDNEGNCSYKKQKKCTKQYFKEKVEGK